MLIEGKTDWKNSIVLLKSSQRADDRSWETPVAVVASKSIGLFSYSNMALREQTCNEDFTAKYIAARAGLTFAVAWTHPAYAIVIRFCSLGLDGSTDHRSGTDPDARRGL